MLNRYLVSFDQVKKIAGACFVFTIVVLIFSCAAQSRNKDALAQEISNAFHTNALTTYNSVNTDYRRGKYLFNDCLILQTLLIRKGSLFSDVVASNIFKDNVAEPCGTLKKAAVGGQSFETYSYSRYFWGAKAFVGLALAVGTVDQIKRILAMIVYGILLGAVGVAVFKFYTKLNAAYSPAVTIFVIAFCLLTIYDLPNFAVTFSHGFSELVIGAYLLYCIAWPQKVIANQNATPWRLILLGAFTAWFELLTGPIVMAIGAAVLVEHSFAVDRPQPLARAFRVSVIVALSAAFTMLWLQLFVALFADSHSVLQFFYHLFLRMQLHLVFDIPIEQSWQIKENMRHYPPSEVVTAILDCIKLLAYNHAAIAGWLFFCSLVCLSACLVFAWLTRFYFESIVVYGYVFIFLLVWYFTFSNHTAIHAFMMVRPLVLLPICAILAFHHLSTMWVINGRSFTISHNADPQLGSRA